MAERRYLAEKMLSREGINDILANTPQTPPREVAVEYLTQSDLPLMDVAARVGFSEASTFHRAFKGWTGLTPGTYRQAHNEPADGHPVH